MQRNPSIGRGSHENGASDEEQALPRMQQLSQKIQGSCIRKQCVGNILFIQVKRG